LKQASSANEAAQACIVANKLDQAIDLYSRSEEYEDGKIVKALQLTGVLKPVID
jgi:hypothetical protein